MKPRDCDPSLPDTAVVEAMVIRLGYASMALENQAVALHRPEALYTQTAPALCLQP